MMFNFILLFMCTFCSKVTAECCKTKGIEFVMNRSGMLCESFGGRIPFPDNNIGGAASSASSAIGSLLARKCMVNACADGKPPKTGYHCGIGKCNVFGCNCDGGCVGGDRDPIAEFKKNYGNNVKDVGPSLWEAVTNPTKDCCVRVFEYAKWMGDSLDICDCGDACINVPPEWKNRISSVSGFGPNIDLTFFSQPNCEGNSLYVTGAYSAINPFASRYCRRDFRDDSYFGGCKSADMNDNSESVKITHRNAFVNAVHTFFK